MNAPTSPTVVHSPHRWLMATLVVTSISGTTMLIAAGFASASTRFGSVTTSSSASEPVSEIFGLPVGTAIWALLGVVALILGMTTVGRSRRRMQPETPSATAEPVPAAA